MQERQKCNKGNSKCWFFVWLQDIVVFTFLGKWLFVSHAGDSNSDSNGNLIKLENVTDVSN